MNRKAKNIIFWTVAVILIILFVIGFYLGCIKNIYGAGTSIYNSTLRFIQNVGFNASDFFKWAPFICVGAGALLTFMFFKKYNSRIN